MLSYGVCQHCDMAAAYHQQVPHRHYWNAAIAHAQSPTDTVVSSSLQRSEASGVAAYNCLLAAQFAHKADYTQDFAAVGAAAAQAHGGEVALPETAAGFACCACDQENTVLEHHGRSCLQQPTECLWQQSGEAANCIDSW